jgi:hypothetical protein
MDLNGIAPSAELVLLCVREGWATTSDTLVQVFGYLPEESHTGHAMLQDALLKLERANLLTIEGKQRTFRDWSFSVAKNLLDIQVALGVSLKSLAANSHAPDLVDPRWKFALGPLRAKSAPAAVRRAGRRCPEPRLRQRLAGHARFNFQLAVYPAVSGPWAMAGRGSLFSYASSRG